MHHAKAEKLPLFFFAIESVSYMLDKFVIYEF